MSKLLSKLSKSEILSLPGFNDYRSSTIRELKSILKKNIKDFGIDFRGVRVNHYINKYKEFEDKRRADDDELFSRISNMKRDMRSHEYYKQSFESSKKLVSNG